MHNKICCFISLSQQCFLNFDICNYGTGIVRCLFIYLLHLERDLRIVGVLHLYFLCALFCAVTIRVERTVSLPGQVPFITGASFINSVYVCACVCVRTMFVCMRVLYVRRQSLASICHIWHRSQRDSEWTSRVQRLYVTMLPRSVTYAYSAANERMTRRTLLS